MKSSGIGGQAVLEGIMMKNHDKYAVAVRKPDNEIAIEVKEYIGFGEKHSILKLPLIRGVVAFVESMVIGMKTLTYSASFFEEEENIKEAEQAKETKAWKEKLANAITIFIAIALAIGLFIMLPFFGSQLLSKVIESQVILTLIEGIIRIVLFIGYVAIISQVKDIKRVFMYHGAEHKTINCIERGFELTVQNVKKQSKEHKRCGTSFLLFVMVISFLLFMVIRVDTLWLRTLLRLLLIPVIAGIAYEFIRLAGRSESKIVQILSKPGLLMQGLTTKEPEEDMIEVAIAAVDAVFDWKTYLEENFNQKEVKKLHQRTETRTRKEGIPVKNTPVEKEEKDTVIPEKEMIPERTMVSVKAVPEKAAIQKTKLNKDAELVTTPGKISEALQEKAKRPAVVSYKKQPAIKVNETEKVEELVKLDKFLAPESARLLKKQQEMSEKLEEKNNKQHSNTTEIAASLAPNDEEEESDEVLRALDRFFINEKKYKK